MGQSAFQGLMSNPDHPLAGTAAGAAGGVAGAALGNVAGRVINKLGSSGKAIAQAGNDFANAGANTGGALSPEEMQMAARVADDLPPANRASRNLVKFVFGEDEHEEALFGRANHWLSEGSRGRYAGQGTVQEARVQ
ncbi:hypothetical protein A8D76_30345 [Burkholderia cenocepacia]|nr:hypothetical protein A8D76_30345 [Burkholderia cenocepacia]